MEYIISESQLKKILEQSNEPSMAIITKLFKMLNDEKKKHKTRAALIEVIKGYTPYLNIPERIVIKYSIKFPDTEYYCNFITTERISLHEPI